MEEIKYCKRGHPRTPENTLKNGRCKLCRREDAKKYYEKNRDKCIEYFRTHYEKNKDIVKELRRTRYANNPDIAKAQCKEWRKNNPDKVREMREKWESNRRDAIKEQRSQRVKRLDYSYIASGLKIRTSDLPPEIYELKRNKILLSRALRELKYALKG